MAERQLLPWMVTAGEVMKTPLRYHTSGQAVGPCPRCEMLEGYGGDDRLVCFEEGNWYCRGCKRARDDNHPNRPYTGWWDKSQTAEQIRERKEAKLERSREAYTQMHTNQDWIGYHQAVMADPVLMTPWFDQGVSEDTIIRWGLGYCNETPTDEERGPSLTIPVFYQTKLYDIRHRMLACDERTKYRSHLPGLTPVYFNLDGIKESRKVLFVEGEKKALILMQGGFTPCVAYPGINFLHYAPQIIKREGTKEQEFIFVTDPGTEDQVQKTISPLVREGWICSITDHLDKPDDFLLEHGPQVFTSVLEMRRRL